MIQYERRKNLENSLFGHLKPGAVYNSYKDLETEKRKARNVEYIISNWSPTEQELEKDLLKNAKKEETKSLLKIGLSSLATIAYGIYEVANQNPSVLIFAPMMLVSN